MDTGMRVCACVHVYGRSYRMDVRVDGMECMGMGLYAHVGRDVCGDERQVSQQVGGR